MIDIPQDRPDAAELLAIARDVFSRELQPVLPPGLRLSGLMVLNALGIAERELRLPRPGLLDARPLAHAIRAGRHDRDVALHAELLEDARTRVAVANPRYLER
ncbi:MAG: hypothetical protein JNK67_17540 [Alphaproteobacteria bacterium]|nr:hypothetical protein [Alphaproteobacteria bacterium]